MAGTYISGFWNEQNGSGGTLTSRPLDDWQTTAMFNALIGAAPGGLVQYTRYRVGHKQFNLGTDPGVVVTPQPVVELNRNSTTADVTALKNLVVNTSHQPQPYPADRSGNGGKAL